MIQRYELSYFYNTYTCHKFAVYNLKDIENEKNIYNKRRTGVWTFGW